MMCANKAVLESKKTRIMIGSSAKGITKQLTIVSWMTMEDKAIMIIIIKLMKIRFFKLLKILGLKSLKNRKKIMINPVIITISPISARVER